MFKVFAFYNKLLNRKKVRQAIQSYQADLLTQVMGDIRKLGERLQQEPKKEHRLSYTRSIPDTANRIIWLDQLKTRLKGYER
jgi:dynein heavy chain 1